MLLLKLSLLCLLLFSFNLFATENGINYQACLDTDISTEVNHKGKFWGLVKHNLDIQKNKCVIIIKHKKVFSNSWEIDVCRQPVHIKIVSSGVEVLKRDGMCLEPANAKVKRSDYCTEFDKIISSISDDGLIFAQGEKENIDSPHGKIYCVYALIKKYLQNGFVMSRREDFDWSKGIDESEKKVETCILPSEKDKSEITIKSDKQDEKDTGDNKKENTPEKTEEEKSKIKMLI